ncbi:MAG: hypothetical protein AAFV90_13260 [Cyanobacteria bacterium J06634_5]
MKQFLRQSLRCSLVASAIAVAGVSTTASGAFAQAAPVDDTVNFTGTVGSVCTFSNVVDGELGLDGPNSLESDSADGGLTGSIDLECTGPAEVSVSLPEDNGSTTDILTGANNYGAEVQVDPTNFTVNTFGGGPSGPINFAVGPVSETLNVFMFVNAGSAIPAGAYDYNVVVTATPQ